MTQGDNPPPLPQQSPDAVPLATPVNVLSYSSILRRPGAGPALWSFVLAAGSLLAATAATTLVHWRHATAVDFAAVTMPWVLFLIPTVAVLPTAFRRSRDPAVGLGRVARCALLMLLLGGAVVAACVAVAFGHHAAGTSAMPDPALAVRSVNGACLEAIQLAVSRERAGNGGQFPRALESLKGFDPNQTSSLIYSVSQDNSYPPRKFAYYGHLLNTDAPPHAVVATDNLADHGGDGIMVLYVDGTIAWLAGEHGERVSDALDRGHNPPASE